MLFFSEAQDIISGIDKAYSVAVNPMFIRSWGKRPIREKK